MRGYDPFPYRPMLRYFYSGAPLPQAVTDVAKANPGSLPYMDSMYQFNQWLKGRYPQAHNAVAASAPDLLNPPKMVTSGAIAPSASSIAPHPALSHYSKLSGLRGLAEMVDSQPASEWGRMVADLTKSAMQLVAQHDIIKMNVSRAEQGLPPIDPGTVAPQVQVGMAPDTQKLVMVAVGGAMLLGLLAIVKGRK